MNIPGSTVGLTELVGRSRRRGGDKVFSFSLSTDAQVTIDLCSPYTNYDTYLHLFAACPISYHNVGSATFPRNAQAMISNDDGPYRSCRHTWVGRRRRMTPSRISTGLKAGQQYFIVVGGYGSHNGAHGLTMKVEQQTPNQYCQAQNAEAVVAGSTRRRRWDWRRRRSVCRTYITPNRCLGGNQLCGADRADSVDVCDLSLIHI